MEQDRSSDTAETFGDQPLPDSASNQNAEEDPTPESSGGGGGQQDPDPPDEDAGRQNDERQSGTVGGAGEHSQATGHPDNAG
ncbi:MAG: hypothetical protein M3Z27_06070 [Actinomycetota bacterium]|nr:hypothetical protein [Actinomycetota bacterium]